MSVRRTLVALIAATFAAAALAVVPLSAEAAAGPAGEANPTSLHFPDTYAEEDSTPQTVTFTSTGTTDLVIDGPVTFDEDDPDTAASFRIIGSSCDNATLAPGAHCTVTVVAHPETVGQAGGWLDFNSNGAYVQVTMFVTSLESTTGQYFPLTPHRLLDTRSGVGAGHHAVGAGSTTHLSVLGAGGLPATGVAAVVLNLTVTHPTTAGHVTVFPSGTTQPGVSTINYAKGWTGANELTVPVGAGGQVDLYNSSGSVDLIVDVIGWYASSHSVDPGFGPGSGYAPRALRVLDTRSVKGAHQPLAPHQTLQVVIPTHSTVAGTRIHAAAVTLTAIKPMTTGYLSAGRVGSDLTVTSTLNLQIGVTTPNLAIVPVTPCTQGGCSDPSQTTMLFDVYNGSSQPVNLLVDLQGFYRDPLDAPYRFHPLSPQRIVDTRSHLGATRLGPASTRTVNVPISVASNATIALAANVTAVAPTATTYLTLWPIQSGVTRPNVSTLNPSAGTTVASGALVALDFQAVTGRDFAIYNSSGSTNVLVDVTGRFDYFQPDDPII